MEPEANVGASPFRIEFVIDREYDVGYVHYMLTSKKHTASLHARAAGMHVDAAVADEISRAGDCPESQARVRARDCRVVPLLAMTRGEPCELRDNMTIP